MVHKIEREHMTVQQSILLYVYEKNDYVTIEEISKELEIPRSTASDHLEFLKKDGLLELKKDGREKRYHPVVEIRDKIKIALSNLKQAYVYALGHIRQKQLKEMKKE